MRESKDNCWLLETHACWWGEGNHAQEWKRFVWCVHSFVGLMKDHKHKQSEDQKSFYSHKPSRIIWNRLCKCVLLRCMTRCNVPCDRTDWPAGKSSEVGRWAKWINSWAISRLHPIIPIYSARWTRPIGSRPQGQARCVEVLGVLRRSAARRHQAKTKQRFIYPALTSKNLKLALE